MKGLSLRCHSITLPRAVKEEDGRGLDSEKQTLKCSLNRVGFLCLFIGWRVNSTAMATFQKEAYLEVPREREGTGKLMSPKRTVQLFPFSQLLGDGELSHHHLVL